MELVFATAAGTIVIVAAGIIMFVGHTSWNRAWRKVNLQRDAAYAMFIISRSIREGTSAKLENDGRELWLYTDEGWMRFHVVLGADKLQLKCEKEIETTAQNLVTILDDKVEDLQFNVEGNKVTIALKLNKDGMQTHSVSTVMMRNYGG